MKLIILIYVTYTITTAKYSTAFSKLKLSKLRDDTEFITKNDMKQIFVSSILGCFHKDKLSLSEGNSHIFQSNLGTLGQVALFNPDEAGLSPEVCNLLDINLLDNSRLKILTTNSPFYFCPTHIYGKLMSRVACQIVSDDEYSLMESVILNDLSTILTEKQLNSLSLFLNTYRSAYDFYYPFILLMTLSLKRHLSSIVSLALSDFRQNFEAHVESVLSNILRKNWKSLFWDYLEGKEELMIIKAIYFSVTIISNYIFSENVSSTISNAQKFSSSTIFLLSSKYNNLKMIVRKALIYKDEICLLYIKCIMKLRVFVLLARLLGHSGKDHGAKHVISLSHTVFLCLLEAEIISLYYILQRISLVMYGKINTELALQDEQRWKCICM